jgi:hypothetical protein
MARLNQFFALSAVTLLTLAGCNSAKEASTPQTSPAAIPGAANVNTSEKATEKATSQGNNAELISVVSSTKAAVQTGDFAKAKAEFDKFESAWKNVEDGIKAKSPKNYEAVEDTTEKVMAELKKSQPSKDEAIAQLQLLETTINSIPKS